MTLLLASWLATQQWSWDAVPTATSYRIYYGSLPMTWCALQYVEVTTTSANIPEPTGNAIFFNVVAVNAAGESTWDHGSKVPCP